MKRLDPKIRRKQILDVALALAERRGFGALTREAIAKAAGVTASLVSHYFISMASMRKAVMKEAVSRESLNIIAHGLTTNHIHTRKLGPDLKRRALNYALNHAYASNA